MKKTTALIAGAGALALTLAACGGGGDTNGTTEPGGGDGGGGESGDQITLILGHAGSETDPRHPASLQLKELIEERSDGNITVEVYANSTLGSWEEMIEGLNFGTSHLVIESILALEAYTELAAVDPAPFLYESNEHFFSVWDGELGDEIKTAITEATGFELLGNMFRSSRELTTKEPVTELGDLGGMTIRTPSAATMVQTWEALGARAEPLAWNEVYSALEAGVLDGQENPLDAILFNSIHEVAPNITLTGHQYANYHFLASESYLAGLPQEYQDIIREAADEVGQTYTENTVSNVEEYRTELEADGAVFHELGDRDAWVEATQSVRDGLPEQVKTWIEQIQAMR